MSHCMCKDNGRGNIKEKLNLIFLAFRRVYMRFKVSIKLDLLTIGSNNLGQLDMSKSIINITPYAIGK
jgi:hypothetical protein